MSYIIKVRENDCYVREVEKEKISIKGCSELKIRGIPYSFLIRKGKSKEGISLINPKLTGCECFNFEVVGKITYTGIKRKLSKYNVEDFVYACKKNETGHDIVFRASDIFGKTIKAGDIYFEYDACDR